MTITGFRVMEIPTGCHVWLGGKSRKGYGTVGSRDGGSTLAHRVAWEEANGPIPEGLTVDHLCQNKACINVDHMELVTSGENSARAHRLKAYCPRGHEYTENNTHRNGHGWRYCRTCHNEAQRRTYAESKAQTR